MLLAVLAACSAPSSAVLQEQVYTIENGTVDGGVYVGGGPGSGDDPTEQDFNVPTGDIKWARLYTHVWASGKSSGWLNITFYNGTEYTQNDKYLEFDYSGPNDEQEGYYVSCGYGVYLRYLNVTNITKNGYNNASAVTSGFGIGSISGIVLVVLYDDGGPPVAYWINQGYIHMGGTGAYPCAVPSTATWFNGSIETGDVSPVLWTGYLSGSDGEPDYLSFNTNELSADAADGGGETADSSWQPGSFFDIDSWVIEPGWLSGSNQRVDFVNGDPPDGESGETSLRVFLAIMVNQSDPDLNVTEIDPFVEVDGQTPIGLVTGRTYLINTTVKNKGTGAANDFNVTLREDGVLRNDTFISSLNGTKETVLQFNWTNSTAGDYTLNVTADAYGVVDEVDEDNNASTKTVTVLGYGSGPTDIGLTSSDIAFSPAFGNNNTTITVKLTNWNTTNADDFDVNMTVKSGGTPVYSTNMTTSLYALHCRYVEFEYDGTLAGSPYTIMINVTDVAGETVTDNNNVSKELTLIRCRIYDSHHRGNVSNYNGTLSDWAIAEMFDITKLAPANTNPVELLASVANITAGASTLVMSVEYNGTAILDHGTEMVNNETRSHYWYPYVNGIPVPGTEWETHNLCHDDVLHWDILAYIQGTDGNGEPVSYKPRLVMDYPEPFLHGYEGTVDNVTIVYPDEILCYKDKADAIRVGLNGSGVPEASIHVRAYSEVTDLERDNAHLILLGTPTNNPFIAYVNSIHTEVGMPIYFDGDKIIDDSFNRSDAYDPEYELSFVIESCDNPYDETPTAGHRCVWLAAAVEDYWAYKAADVLANDTNRLDRFWLIDTTSDLVPTWDGTNAALNWDNWTGTCSSFDVYITNNLTAGFPASPNATVSTTSWLDTNAGADPEQRYYMVTCNTTGEQIEGNVSKIAYELKSGANWITMPSMNPPKADADEFIKSTGSVTVVWWNSTSQNSETYNTIPFPPYYSGDNFEVKPARGYEVQVSSDTGWSVAGWVPSVCPVKLKSGANWIGMQFNTTIDDADELIKDIGMNCPTVVWWNSTSQNSETYNTIPFPPYYSGDNFEVKPARGYEIQVNVDMTWIPR